MPWFAALFLRFLSSMKAAAPTTAREPTMVPTAIPAMAPLLRPFELLLDEEVAVTVAADAVVVTVESKLSAVTVADVRVSKQ